MKVCHSPKSKVQFGVRRPGAALACYRSQSAARPAHFKKELKRFRLSTKDFGSRTSVLTHQSVTLPDTTASSEEIVAHKASFAGVGRVQQVCLYQWCCESTCLVPASRR